MARDLSLGLGEATTTPTTEATSLPVAETIGVVTDNLIEGAVWGYRRERGASYR